MPTVSEVSVALDPMAHDRFDGLLALSNLLIMHQRNTIAEFAMKQRDFMATDWRAVRASNEKMSLLREGLGGLTTLPCAARRTSGTSPRLRAEVPPQVPTLGLKSQSFMRGRGGIPDARGS
jgi:hypothetical protein